MLTNNGHELTPIVAGPGMLTQGPGTIALTVQPMTKNSSPYVAHAWTATDVRESVASYIAEGGLNRALKSYGQGALVRLAYVATANIRAARLVAADFGFPAEALAEARGLANHLVEQQHAAERRRLDRERRQLDMEIRVGLAELTQLIRQRHR